MPEINISKAYIQSGIGVLLGNYYVIFFFLTTLSGSPHHDTVSEGILNMQEHSDLLRIYDK